jgi:hypothetical protein
MNATFIEWCCTQKLWCYVAAGISGIPGHVL